jgi:addiction module HigA family antidote
MTSVAERLMYELVNRRKATVTDVASALDISRPALSKVLNGRAELSVELALKIETTFGLDAHKLLFAQLEEQIANARRHGHHLPVLRPTP